ncbi:hypothetical protein [Marinomonas sp. PE14-40]|uniref:hypothetical protein n=1 Tax=Marinomonas sp. PE14-40 TaxID=3060621 RepID=UPI003F664848
MVACKKMHCTECGWGGTECELKRDDFSNAYCPECCHFDFLIDDAELIRKKIIKPVYNRQAMAESLKSKHAQYLETLRGLLKNVSDSHARTRLERLIEKEASVSIEPIILEQSDWGLKCFLDSFDSSAIAAVKAIESRFSSFIERES